MPGRSEYPPIEDYALIGDCRAAALVSRAGAIEWLCLPRFDSPSVFAAILDRSRGGSFYVRPAGDPAAVRVRRRYVGPTNLLETTFETPGGTLRLTDAMAVASMEERRHELRVEHEILRRVECTAGEVEVEVLCEPRPFFGRQSVRARDHRRLGFGFEAGPQVLALQSEIPLAVREDGCAVVGRARLAAGERRYLSLAAESGDPAAIPPLSEHAEARLERSRRWWERWAARCTYDGPHPEAVQRSILALKLLTYAPSGAVIAAPTTSLPEAIGGTRNWDYRYCWLRDASWTLDAFLDLGYQEEGMAFLSWLIHATRVGRSRGVGILYDVHGESRIGERKLPWLAGYAGSRPVRVGNGAAGQLQLDVYGEVVEAAHEFVRRGGKLDSGQARLLVALGEIVCRIWGEPDEGIWEKRSGRFHHTFSKVMCWVALDRLLRLNARGQLRAPARSLARFAREREAIRRAVTTQGWNAAEGSYVDVLGGDAVDASLLLLGIYGFEDAGSPRVRATFDRIDRELGRELGAGPLLYRYVPGTDGIAGGEAPFGICSFWAVEALARMGEVGAALDRFERLLACANDVGLYAEQIEPETGAARGNFPQAFSHVGLINAALTLAERLGTQPAKGSAPGATGARM